jgi:predicted nucleotidyltransferase
MAAEWRIQEQMLQTVADALGPELVRQVAFVGGCTTALLITDAFARESVRFTEDVDVIVHVLGYGKWQGLLSELRQRGFRESPEDDIICRMRLPNALIGRDLLVDFMPDDEAILNFTNRWYRDALRSATDHALPSGTLIRVVTPGYFLATKLEAYRGRGRNDPLASRDIEDILAVVDGRDSLQSELLQAEPALGHYIAQAITDLLAHRDFPYAVQAAARQQQAREELIFQRLEAITTLPAAH